MNATTRIKLTHEQIEHEKPASSGSRRFIWDNVVSGLALRITDTGAKSLVVVGRVKGQRHPIRVTIGRWRTGEQQPVETLTGDYRRMGLADARDIARHLISMMRGGTNPNDAAKQAEVERTREIAAAAPALEQKNTPKVTIATQLEVWRRRHLATLNPSTSSEVERSFTNWFLPAWRDRDVASITRRDAAEVLQRIVDSGKRVTANRATTHLKLFFRDMVDRGVITASPVEGMRRQGGKEKPRSRYLQDHEIRALWAATAEHHEHKIFNAAVRFLLLSGQRLGDVFGMAWNEIDMRTGVWTIPEARYKTKREHVITLSREALAIVAAQPRMFGVDLIFSTSGKNAKHSVARWKRELDTRIRAELGKAAAQNGDPSKVNLPRWTIHDLRRTARTLMSRAKVRPDIAERAIGHAQAGIVAVYDRHGFQPEIKDAIERLAATVAAIVAGKTTDNLAEAA